MSSRNDDALRIFTPIGNVGYGYSTEIFWNTLQTYNVDAIICDAGSTDSGPQKLALGHTTVPKESYESDLEPMVAAAHDYHVPVIITSVGGDGSNDHVDLMVDLLDKIVHNRSYRTLKVLKLYAEIPKQTVTEALYAQPTRIAPCGGGAPPLTTDNIDSASRIVAQMGIEPFLDAMNENPDFDIIIAGRTYDPAPYAAFCTHHGISDLGVAYHMGKIMECGAQCSVPKSREALATINKYSFDITPLDPAAHCTGLSVAAHALYEKSRPDFHYGPDGMLDLTRATYTELPDGRSVRVQGSVFYRSTPESKWTIKLEGARTNGYHSLFVGGFADPILISQLDDILPMVKAYVASKCPFEHSLRVTTYGRDNALRIKCQDDTSVSRSRPSVHQAPTVGILGQANAATQREANMVVAMARIACVHGPYLGQKATSGNFAMPTAPQEIEMGLVSEFNIYHLMTIDDPLSPFSCEVHLSEGSGQCKAVEKTLGPGTAAAPKRTNATPNSTRTDFKLFSFAPNQLGHLASIIRTKNAGPFEITFDAIFDSPAVYERVKASGVLAKSKVAEVLGIPESNVLVAMWWEQALAFKATIVRPMVSGGFGEIDMHGSCQHVPLMELEIPVRAGEVVAKQISSLSAGTRQLMAWCRDRRLGQVSMLLVAFSVASLMRLGKSSAVIEWLRWNTKK